MRSLVSTEYEATARVNVPLGGGVQVTSSPWPPKAARTRVFTGENRGREGGLADKLWKGTAPQLFPSSHSNGQLSSRPSLAFDDLNAGIGEGIAKQSFRLLKFA